MEKERLHPPETFQFPFPPYDIQHQFMTHLYSAIECGKLGIFESPTGTGKSMSMICGALAWLDDHETHTHQTLEAAVKDSVTNNQEEEGKDWFSYQTAKQAHSAGTGEQRKQLQLIESKLKEMAALRQRVAARRKAAAKSDVASTRKEEISSSLSGAIKRSDDCTEDDDLILDDYLGKEENEIKEDSEGEEDKEEEYQTTKVFFCSRTHSQLSQLASELRRSSHAAKRAVCLASRQCYCINRAVRSLGSASLVNERCLELQRKGSKRAEGEAPAPKRARRSGPALTACPYRQRDRVTALQEDALYEVQDVEELVQRGRKMQACPYYATRAAVNDAQVVFLPYNTLLHKATRTALGINLSGNIVIIDEAHNLLDTIANIHSAEVTGQQLASARDQVSRYRSRYESRFSAANLLRLDQLLFYLSRLLRLLGEPVPGRPPTPARQPGSCVYRLMEFIVAAEVDSVNPFHLVQFCHTSQLAQKLRGFADKNPPEVQIHENKTSKKGGLSEFLKEISSRKTETQPGKPGNVAAVPEASDEPVSKAPLLPVLSFLECLMNDCKDSRVVCIRQATVGRSRLKFLLLNPAEHFKSMVEEARAVIVTGGTMQPVTEFRDQLFLAAGGEAERVVEFSCDHIVPPENILPIALAAGPTGKTLNFSYESRSSPDMIAEVGRTLANMCNVVPGGIVCFFPSYDYEQVVYNHMQQSGTLKAVLAKKKVFREPKKASETEEVLRDYAQCIRLSRGSSGLTGALMLSVVGGKLSEGLNFSDDLGRLVVVVGLPFPNSQSPEVKEKMAYLAQKQGAPAGQRYYEALCMKAVNQSIGRAIRHRTDYAAVLLADARYQRPAVQAALPSWIRRSLCSQSKFGPAVGQLARKAREEFFVISILKDTDKIRCRYYTHVWDSSKKSWSSSTVKRLFYVCHGTMQK